jgi:tyrosyl-tRNA synthetase
MDMKNVEFLWASENMSQEYWLRVLRIGMNNSVARITRCAQIMGRSEKEELSAAQIFYPCMQTSDIFQLDVDIAQLGMDQRKVNVLAREIAPKLGYKKPVAVHHHMLAGLGKPPVGVEGVEAAIAKKMSKSNPDSAIFMTDTEEDIKRKINKAYCLEGEIKDNPILEYCKYIIFEKSSSIDIKRPAKFGGNISYKSYEELEKDFAEKKLHPMDLKEAVIILLNDILKPVRDYFEKNAEAKKLKEKVESYIITK